MMLSFLRGDTAVPALPMALKHSGPYQLLALENSFPLQRMVVFCSPLPGAQMVPYKEGFLPHIFPERSWGTWGLWAALVTASLLLTQPQIATQTLSCHEENLPWVELGHNKQVILLQFSVCPDPDISVPPPQSPSTSPAANLCSSMLDG